MTLRVLVFAEDALGLILARDLCDRVVLERGPGWLAEVWSDPSLIETQRVWRGIEPTDSWTKWTRLSDHDRRHRAVHGLGMKGHALVAYRAAHIAARLDPIPDVVVFCIDTQGKADLREEMLDGLRRARVDDLAFVLAVAHQESEAWVLAGFAPEGVAEETMLRRQVVVHGFDPTRDPHRLTPNRPTDPHDAKRVGSALLPDGMVSQRARRCWLDAPLDDLERHGRATGLPEYLADIARSVLPLLTGGAVGSTGH
ncbi:MAG: hypothetical protein Q8S73_37935 [Deltaproteobacteria bacterium]|nr:hypothetical protein [Myxococcales bacterium]MDP3219943.1 hypothetical protein [Deltaproteobacteria bacterium]